jgi:hypothetical protein
MPTVFEAQDTWEQAVERYQAEPTDANKKAVESAVREFEAEHAASYMEIHVTAPDRDSAEAILAVFEEKFFVRSSRIAKRRNGLPGFSVSVSGYWYY